MTNYLLIKRQTMDLIRVYLLFVLHIITIYVTVKNRINKTL